MVGAFGLGLATAALALKAAAATQSNTTGTFRRIQSPDLDVMSEVARQAYSAPAAGCCR
jgi:hypothetical protein